MQQNTTFTRSALKVVVTLILLISGMASAQIPTFTMRIVNIEKGTQDAKFSVYLKNTSASSFLFSGCQLAIDFNKDILKNQNDSYGTPTLTLVSSGLPVAMQPRNPVVITTEATGLLRVSPAAPPRTPGGANNAPSVAAGDSLLIGTFNLHTTNPTFAAGQELNLTWRTASNPYTKVGGYLSSVNTEIQSGSTYLINTFSSSVNFAAIIEAMFDGSNMIPDTMTVSLRKTTAPYDVVDQHRVLVGANGLATLSFKHGVPGQSYYLVVNHRNAIETWSADNAITSLAASQSYDMTTAADKAYGSNMTLVGAKWCIFSGDVNQDGEVGALDMNEVDNGSALFLSGYEAADVNGDTEVGALDMNFVDNNSSAFVASVKPGAKKSDKPVKKAQEKQQLKND